MLIFYVWQKCNCVAEVLYRSLYLFLQYDHLHVLLLSDIFNIVVYNVTVFTCFCK